MNQQIESFSSSLQNLASEYSDPAVIMQHIPVLKDNLMLQQNPEYLFYWLGGVVFVLFALKRLKKRRSARIKSVAMVMPQPYLGETNAPNTSEIAPSRLAVESPPTSSVNVSEISESTPQLAQTAVLSAAQQLEDVSAISFTARAALTPDEARMRVLVQSSVNEFGGGYMIMARTSLGALLQPGREAVGIERAYALSAIQDKYIDFGVFDRTGRCLVALDVSGTDPALGKKAQEKAIVEQVLNQAGVHVITLSTSDAPTDIQAKIVPYLKATARPNGSPVKAVPSVKTTRKATRPGRPARPVNTTEIAAE